MKLLPTTAGLALFALLLAQGCYAQSASGKSSRKVPVVTLNQALTAAEKSGPGFQMSSDSLQSSRAQFRQAQAASRVSLNGSGGYFHEDYLPNGSKPITTPQNLLSSDAKAQNAIGALTSNPIGENYQAGAALVGPSTNLTVSGQHLSEEGSLSDQVTGVSIQAKQTLFDGYPGGQSKGNLKEASLSFQTAQVAHTAAIRSLKLQVQQAYYTLLDDQNAARVAVANQAQAKEDLDRVQSFLSVSEATQLDVMQARVAYEQAQLSVSAAKHTALMARKSLSALIGWPLDREYSVAETSAPSIPTLNLTAALKIAETHRSELKQVDLQISSAEVALQLAQSQYYPTVSATGSLRFEHDWTANYSMGTYTAGVSIALPIAERGRLSAGVAQARAELSSLKLKRRQDVQSISIDVENAIFSVMQGKRSLDVAHQQVQAAQQQYDREKAKLASGIATNLDVLRYSANLMSAQSAFEKAKNRYNLAILGLDDSLGL